MENLKKTQWKKLPEKDPSPPQRPAKGGYGTNGVPIKLKTNYFPVQVEDKNKILYHYNVVIKNYEKVEFLPKEKNRNIFDKMKEMYPDDFKNSPVAYDSMKNSCSTVKLNETCEFKVKLDNGGRKKSTYTVQMELVGEVSLEDFFKSLKYNPKEKAELNMTAIQMMEIMFRHNLARNYAQISDRNFFSVKEEFAADRTVGPVKIGVTGFFGSLRPAQWNDGSLLLNLDMVHRPFLKTVNLTEFISETSKGIKIDFNKTLSEYNVQSLTKILKNIKIVATTTNNKKITYKIREVNNYGPRETKFEFQTMDGKLDSTTVEGYYLTRYGMQLKYPHFNCLNCGSQNKQVFIPVEICAIAKGQRATSRLTEEEAQEMHKISAVGPAERLKQIKYVAQKNKFNNDEFLKALTFSISKEPLSIEGRILPRPKITMNKLSFFPCDGKWDLRNKKFHHAAALQEWAIINYDNLCKEDHLRKFVSNLIELGDEHGMLIAKQYDYRHNFSLHPDAEFDLRWCKKQNPKIQLVMFFLPASKRFYGGIKKAGDIELKILTQCVKGDNVRKNNASTIVNILLKMNAKLNGTNNIISLTHKFPTGLMKFNKPFIILGADVSHPPAGCDEAIPSIVAVVGSYDIDHGVKYAPECRGQNHRKEVILDMKEITKNLLINFFRRTGQKPERIILFRDGVSDSQFSAVLAHELLAMRAACTELEKEYTPGMTFICVQKRHHTRLFYEDDKKNDINVSPGTIVDEKITHPKEIDFYLCSHKGIIGTSKPAHYHLLWDDNDFPIDELQELTYKLCHVYTRCARSVSIPAPVYYAHLAAFRANNLVTEILGSGRQNIRATKEEIESKKNEIIKAIRVSAAELKSSNFSNFYYI